MKISGVTVGIILTQFVHSKIKIKIIKKYWRGEEERKKKKTKILERKKTRDKAKKRKHRFFFVL